jgi:hypothetical protein
MLSGVVLFGYGIAGFPEIRFAPALGQDVPLSGGPASSGTQGSASIPDFSGIWSHPYFPGIEPPASGPGPVTNRLRLPSGQSDPDHLVGDYTNPVLKPAAAEVVRKHGEMEVSGVGAPTPSNQCWPEPVPYIFWNWEMQMLQQADKITILYWYDHEVRHVRMNQPHPARVTPSWYGDSVGHYEGDTLVIDTVGVKTDRKYAMIDLFGTPYTDKLHIVERYRLHDYDDVKGALERNEKENWLVAGDVWSRHRGGKFLQLHVTIEDEGVFTTPWTATLTYAPGPAQIGQSVCAENRNEYYNNKESDVPKAEKPDF